MILSAAPLQISRLPMRVPSTWRLQSAMDALLRDLTIIYSKASTFLVEKSDDNISP